MPERGFEDMIDSGVLRILDANLNRTQEALRVCEEYARFILESKALCERWKPMRHRLREAETLLRGAAGRTLESCRDTAGDVGTQVSAPTEFARSGADAVAKANIKRLQESLRVLEEYGKIVSPAAAVLFEEMRYSIYDLENLMLAGTELRKRLAAARLYVLVTGKLASADALTAAREAVAGGADVIQLREKDMEDGAFYQLALMMRQICGTKALFLINDRPHIAKLVRADGVHVGQGDLPVNLVRRLIGQEAIVGKSTSGPEIADLAVRDGVDYIGVGPVFETKTKEHRAPVGLEYVRWAAQNAKVPYFCIGSINRNTLPQVLQAGARAVAVCTGIIAAKDIAAETAWYKEQILAATQG